MPPENKIRIAALGSSFAAGPSIAPIENAAAGRSAKNYAHQLAEKLDADLTDLTVSGATLLNVLNEKQNAGGVVFAPQIEGLSGNEDLVTLTCGGNDLGYIGSLIHDTLISYVGPSHPLVLSSAASNPAPAIAKEGLTRRMLKVLEAIHQRTKAKIYLVQYLSLIGDDTRPLYDIALTAEHAAHFDAVSKILADSYLDAAEAFNWELLNSLAGDRKSIAEVVLVASASRNHALGSLEPWVRGFDLAMLMHGPSPFHPNLDGHTAIAEMLYRQIREGMEGSR